MRVNKFPVINKIVPRHVLISVFDKDRLDILVLGLLRINPEVMFYSTGGTGTKVKEILGERAATNYMAVEEYTGAPEMEGGLVKTLHPKIHAGLLGERGNPAHIKYLEETMATMGKGPGVYFDLFVGNLYPFDTVTAKGADAETARINIDIGGPTMAVACAKNWHSVAGLSSPTQYLKFLRRLEENGGFITAKHRFVLAQAALKAIGLYRRLIGDVFELFDFEEDVLPTITLE